VEYIYGLDISLSSYGFAIADEDYNIVDIGTITTHSRQKTESRLSII
jgi:CRISPR/Cas system Type II protein with McrA/HNH and RuvC-like nuclease domain